MGFVSRSDLLAWSPYGYAQVRAGWFPSWLRQWDPGMGAYIYQRASDGAFEEGFLETFPIYLILQSGGLVYYYILPNRHQLDASFEPVPGAAIPPGRYDYVRQRVYYSSDQSRKISGTLLFETGGYFDGQLHTGRVTARLAPTPHASIGVSYEQNELRGVGVDNVDTSADLYSIDGRFALNPQLQLSAFYQYSGAAKQGILNARLSWEYRPLSYFYLVFNELEAGGAGVDERQFTSKLSYTRQF
jgi:hypothetical protein